MAPEVLEKRPYRGASVDIFSAGVVLFTMMTGGMPYQNQATVGDSLYQYIVKKDYSKYWEEWEKSDQQSSKNMKLSDDFKDLIFKMLSYSYTDRPSIKEIKNHKWFQQRLPSIEHVKHEIMKIKLE